MKMNIMLTFGLKYNKMSRINDDKKSDKFLMQDSDHVRYSYIPHFKFRSEYKQIHTHYRSPQQRQKHYDW